MKSSKKYDSQALSETSAPSAHRFHALAGLILIVVAAVIAYLPSIRGGFIFDDGRLLTDNPLIMASDGLYRFWFTTETTDYWPVTYTTLWIEWRLWGRNPIGYHVTNLILHIVEALLIWIILRKLSIPGAFLAAIIFAVHPVNVESVAWISQRKNTMAMLFFLLSILWYLKYSSYPSKFSHPSWYWLSLIAFLLAMLSKGSVAVLPVLLLEIVWWLRPAGTVPIFAGDCPDFCWGLSRFLRSKNGTVPLGYAFHLRDLVRIAPFFVVAVVLAGVNMWFQTHGTGEVFRTASFSERLLGAGGVIWFYLYKALLPINLVFIYPQWRIEVDNLLWWLSLLAVLAVTAVLWRYRKGWSRPFLFAWGFFSVALVPVMGFTDLGFMRYSLVADRYQHIAIIAVIALVSAGFSELHRRVRGKTQWATTVIAVTTVGALTFLSWRQSGSYSDEITLYKTTLEKNPDCWVAHYNLGKTLFDMGKLPEAIEHYRQALRLKLDYPEAHNNLGAALVQTGRYQEGLEHYEEALRFEPNFPEAHNNLGNVLKTLGQYQQAIEHYEQTLRLTPDKPDVHYNLAAVLVQTRRMPEAIEHYEQTLRLKSDNPEAHNNLGAALVQSGRPQEAIVHFQQALALKPDYPEAHYNLGSTFNALGQYQQAIEHYQQALELKPDFAMVYSKLALAYASMNKSSEAIATAQKALELARSKGQTAQVKEIEDWLNSYQGRGIKDK